jgi:TPR repeat protein
MHNSQTYNKLIGVILVIISSFTFSHSIHAANDCTDLMDSKDYYKALDVCKKMAKKGHVGAQYNLGMLYFQGLGVMPDKRIAYKWIHKSAKSNYPEAQYNIGIMTANGIGVKTDLVKAYAWLGLAKANGFEEADSAFAEMSEELSKKEKQAAKKFAEGLLK